ncbi:MAG: GNAT family N-acetyltransferase [Paracoccus sp. (in: a-proteobacteria)]|nr:GNAT family N-acetyltransferase [Paracoccus sp. (in: a-proteobacteria)]
MNTLDALAAAVPVIRTERLTLRAPRMADFDLFADFFASPRSHMDEGPKTRPEAWDLFAKGAGQWLLRGYGQWNVDDAAGNLVARVGLYHPITWPEPELAWMVLDPAAEGRGIAYEAANAARAAAARIWGITRPISSIFPENTRSIRLAERLGAMHEGDRETIYGVMQTWRHSAPEGAR